MSERKLEVKEPHHEFSHHALNANNYPLFKTFNSYLSYPQTAFWATEVLMATIVTGASWPAALYIGTSAMAKNIYPNFAL